MGNFAKNVQIYLWITPLMPKHILSYIFVSFFSSAFLCVAQDNQTSESVCAEQCLDEVIRKADEALENGSISKAIHLYEEFLSEFPNSSEGMTYLGGIYGTKGDFQKEVELCQKAIHINPKLAAAYINLGNAQLALQQWSEAEQSYLRGYKIAKANKDVAHLRSAAYSLSNYYLASPEVKNQQAIEWADICIRHLPDMLVEGRELPNGFGNQFKKDNIELRWIYMSATMNKAGAYANMKDFDSALSILRDYLKKYPESGDVKDMIHSIEMYTQRGK